MKSYCEELLILVQLIKIFYISRSMITLYCYHKQRDRAHCALHIFILRLKSKPCKNYFDLFYWIGFKMLSNSNLINHNDSWKWVIIKFTYLHSLRLLLTWSGHSITKRICMRINVVSILMLWTFRSCTLHSKVFKLFLIKLNN